MDLDSANTADRVWYLENRVIPCLRVFYPKFVMRHDPGTTVAKMGFDELRIYYHGGIQRNYVSIRMNILPVVGPMNRIPTITGKLFSIVHCSFDQWFNWGSLDMMIKAIMKMNL